jgi:hypothetical protein
MKLLLAYGKIIVGTEISRSLQGGRSVSTHSPTGFAAHSHCALRKDGDSPHRKGSQCQTTRDVCCQPDRGRRSASRDQRSCAPSRYVMTHQNILDKVLRDRQLNGIPIDIVTRLVEVRLVDVGLGDRRRGRVVHRTIHGEAFHEAWIPNECVVCQWSLSSRLRI